MAESIPIERLPVVARLGLLPTYIAFWCLLLLGLAASASLGLGVAPPLGALLGIKLTTSGLCLALLVLLHWQTFIVELKWPPGVRVTFIALLAAQAINGFLVSLLPQLQKIEFASFWASSIILFFLICFIKGKLGTVARLVIETAVFGLLLGILLYALSLFGLETLPLNTFFIQPDSAYVLLALISCAVCLAMGWRLLSPKFNGQSQVIARLLGLLIASSGLIFLSDVLAFFESQFLWCSLALLVSFIVLIALASASLNVSVRQQVAMVKLAGESNKAAFIACDRGGEIRYANPAFIQQFGEKESSNLGSNILFNPLTGHPMWSEFKTCLENNQGWSGQTSMADPKGQLLSVQLEIGSLEESGQELFYAVMRDLQGEFVLKEKRQFAEEKLERLSFDLMEKQEEERRYFAKELHDEIGQGLTLLKIQHQLPEPDSDLINHVLSELIDKVRNLSLNLRPAILDDMGLAAALDWLVSRQSQFSQLEINKDISSSIPRLADKLEITVFRIAQEAFTNIHKYAHAKSVDFCCHVENEQLKLIIRDDGIGFDVDAKFHRATQSQSLGLVSIKERAFLVHGEIAIVSSPEDGTQIQLLVPLNSDVGQPHQEKEAG